MARTAERKGFLAKIIMVLTVMLIGGAAVPAAHADKKCDDALAAYKDQLGALMTANREYVQTLNAIAKKMKKSAKNYKVNADYIKHVASDQSVSKKEASKMEKMFQKAQTIAQSLEEIRQKTREFEAVLDETDKAYRKYDNDCDAER